MYFVIIYVILAICLLVLFGIYPEARYKAYAFFSFFLNILQSKNTEISVDVLLYISLKDTISNGVASDFESTL